MAGPGGFVIPLTPPQSSLGSETDAGLLPEPGSRPSRSSGALVHHIDQTLLHISRRYEKRDTSADQTSTSQNDESSGYNSFAQMAKDIDDLIDVIWTSGKPRSQTSTLLSLALTSCTSLSAFPFSPRASFHLFRKLDEAFYSLLTGTVPGTGEPLPGLEGGRGKPTVTEMIRLRGIAERTRLAVVEAAGRNESKDDEESLASSRVVDTTDDDEETMPLDTNNAEDNFDMEMEIARVYERTISQLGQHLNSL